MQKTKRKTDRRIIRTSLTGIIVLLLLTMTACGGKKGPDPITPVERGFTLAQALEADPTLTEYTEEEQHFSISKTLNYAGADGRLSITSSSFKEEPVVCYVHWACEPTEKQCMTSCLPHSTSATASRRSQKADRTLQKA